MHKKNKIYNTYQDSRKRLSKKDFTMIYGLTFIIYFFGAYYSKNQLIALLIIICASVFPVILYFSKIAKKNISECIANKYFGILGVYNAFVCALLLAFQMSNTLFTCLILFFIISFLIFLIIMMIKSFFCKHIKERKTQTIVTLSFVLPFSIAGVLLSKYLINFSMLYELLMGGACSLFAIFYSFTIKYRNMTNNQSGDGSKPLKK